MKHCSILLYLCVLCSGIFVVIDEVDARGGRGRVGGSFGSLFGSWRKYKKPSSTGGQRVLSGSPMHTAMTSSSSLGAPVSVSSGKVVSKPNMKKQPASNYPKQQMPAGYTSMGGHHQIRPAAPPQPPSYGFMPSGQAYPNGAGAGTFYPNAAALPAGAVYYAQPPIRTGHNDFLMGMLTGHMLNSMLYRPNHHITQVYHRPAPTSENESTTSPKVIVINNGQQQEPSGEAVKTIPPQYWPMDSDVPLAEIISTTTSTTMSSSSTNTFPDTSTGEPQLETTDGGIVCFPVLLNETNPDNADIVREVEKIICFPAPTKPQGIDCVLRTYIEPDPLDPTKTVEIEREECLPAASTTTTEPPIVAGEIGDELSNEDTKLDETVTNTN